MITLSCVTKASEEFLPCGLHPVTGQQAGEFMRISHSLNVCSGEATVCFLEERAGHGRLGFLHLCADATIQAISGP